jgi:phytoene dehydrogenase-like protein
MLADWYRPGNCLDYPKGGSGAIVDALVRGVQKWGHVHKTQSAVHVNTHVKEILIEGSGKDARAAGVRLEDGTTILAKQAVVCNIDPFVISKLLSQAQHQNLLSSDVVEFFNTRTDESGDKAGSIPNLNSFIHLHAGIDASGLPPKPSADFPAQWAVIKSWDVEGGVEAPRNIVLCSMPSLLDPSLAPEGTVCCYIMMIKQSAIS